MLKVSQQLSEPVGAMAANGTQFAVSVFRHQLEAVVIVVEFRLVTVGEYLLHGLPTLSKAAYHVLLGNVMPATAHPVGNSQEAFLCAVQADIVQPDTVPFFDNLPCGGGGSAP